MIQAVNSGTGAVITAVRMRLDTRQISRPAASISFRSILKGKSTMPTETAIIVAAIVLAFAVYAGVLAWADFYTHQHPKA
jgi:hypothetical protein